MRVTELHRQGGRHRKGCWGDAARFRNNVRERCVRRWPLPWDIIAGVLPATRKRSNDLFFGVKEMKTLLGALVVLALVCPAYADTTILSEDFDGNGGTAPTVGAAR